MNQFFSNLQQSLARFMIGRNGTDALALYSLIAGAIFAFFDTLTGVGIFSLIGLALLVYSMFRCLSRNISKRRAENAKFAAAMAKPTATVKRWQRRWAQRKTTKFLKCPQCGQSLSVPKGKGELRVTCPKCRNKFTAKS